MLAFGKHKHTANIVEHFTSIEKFRAKIEVGDQKQKISLVPFSHNTIPLTDSTTHERETNERTNYNTVNPVLNLIVSSKENWLYMRDIQS